VFDENAQYNICENHSNVDYNIYNDMEITGKVCSTISKGKFVVKDSIFVGGKGDYLTRELKY